MLSKIIVLWIYFATPGILGDIPRIEGWHVWGSYVNFEQCAMAIDEVKADRRKNRRMGLDVKGSLFAACKMKKNSWTTPLLVRHYETLDSFAEKYKDLQENWRWVLWRYHPKGWSLFGMGMSPGWFSLSVWDNWKECNEARLGGLHNVPLAYKRCLRVDKFPGENSKFLREHSNVTGDFRQAG